MGTLKTILIAVGISVIVLGSIFIFVLNKFEDDDKKRVLIQQSIIVQQEKNEESRRRYLEEQAKQQRKKEEELRSLAKESAEIIRSDLKIAERAIKKKKYGQARDLFNSIDSIMKPYMTMQNPVQEIHDLYDLSKEIRKDLDMYLNICGPRPPDCSENCNYILEYVKSSAHDPSSIEISRCTLPLFHDKYCWIITCSVRGKNMFGALVLQEKTFQITTLGINQIENVK